ncbi:MAG: hypothetical protein H6607_04835 [Flavobacteriales bacterium]|nr:hypothetical protein [Flavobacteriales bacterium]
MKYKRLTIHELEKLEKEFIEFLVINGIEAKDWEKIKQESPTNTEQIIENFSDVVHESTLRKVEYLQLILPHQLLCFYCQPNQIVLVGLQSTTTDFTQIKSLEDIDFSNPEFELFTQTKSYSKPREMELFDLINSGAGIADNTLFTMLCGKLS